MPKLTRRSMIRYGVGAAAAGLIGPNWIAHAGNANTGDDESYNFQLEAEGMAFDAPVLVDPLHQRVYRFPHVERAGSLVTLKDLPLLNYPLLVADEQLVSG